MDDESVIKEQAERIKELERKLGVLEADNFWRLASAYEKIGTCTFKNYMASGLIISVRNINKKDNVVIEDVLIADGFSDEFIAAFRKEVQRTYDLRKSFIRELKIPTSEVKSK